MLLQVNGKSVETNVQGFLQHLDDWDEDIATELAHRDGIQLYNDHWELIYYFREYYEENLTLPCMHGMVRDLGNKSKHFHDRKAIEKHVYKLFPKDPCREICKLAGLPLPTPDD
jgi:tRNA 2-thiouridine synthesizing protein E